MPNVLHILLRILAGIAGALLLYVALFLYEDEEARLQNRLDQIWQKINALQSSAMSREVAFLQGVTRTTSAVLDRLLGRELLSIQSIAVSMTFSFISYFVWMLVWFHVYRVNISVRNQALLMVFCALLCALASLRAFASSDVCIQFSRRCLRMEGLSHNVIGVGYNRFARNDPRLVLWIQA